ncbi:MAG: hypothetical protein LQ339_003168 [Xanthoria mediterranea]|nr:MAG: hypothetical protein LQ339_003168 [Xanthoria mediterranea]
MSILTSPWYGKSSPNEPQQPPSEEIILDDGTKGTKKPPKRKAITVRIWVFVLLAISVLLVIGVLNFIYYYHRSSRGTHTPAVSSVQVPTTTTTTTNDESLPTNTAVIGSDSDFVPYRVPPALSMYAAVPTASRK